MPNMEKLKTTIDDRGVTIVALCKKSGIDRATMYNRLQGKGEWKISEAVKVRDVLNLNNTEFKEIFLH